MLEDIEVFCAIAKHNGFAKAARALHLSTSIVTRRLARLEKKLGVRLMHRSTRQVSLTEEGRIYYQQVSDILEALTLSNKNVKSLSEDITGTLKIGAPVSISHLYLARHLHTLLDEHPNLKLQIVNGNHLLDLLDSGFDCVIHCGELPDSSYHYKKIGTWEKMVCASPAYLKQHGTPKKLADLAKHNCLDHADNFEFTWPLYSNDQITPVTVSGNVRVNSSIDLCELAASSLGIVYLPSFTVMKAIKEKRLVSILDRYRPPTLNMYAVYPSNQYLSKKTQLWLDFLQTIL